MPLTTCPNTSFRSFLGRLTWIPRTAPSSNLVRDASPRLIGTPRQFAARYLRAVPFFPPLLFFLGSSRPSPRSSAPPVSFNFKSLKKNAENDTLPSGSSPPSCCSSLDDEQSVTFEPLETYSSYLLNKERNNNVRDVMLDRSLAFSRAHVFGLAAFGTLHPHLTSLGSFTLACFAFRTTERY